MVLIAGRENAAGQSGSFSGLLTSLLSFMRAKTPVMWALDRWAYRFTICRSLWPSTSAISGAVAPSMAR